MPGYVYILASQRNDTLYVGVTRNLLQRVGQHMSELVDGFSKEHGIKLIVWYEMHEEIYAAITREKQIEEWQRAWKVRMIEETNPYWNDLYLELTA